MITSNFLTIAQSNEKRRWSDVSDQDNSAVNTILQNVIEDLRSPIGTACLIQRSQTLHNSNDAMF